MPSRIEWTTETWNPVTGCTKVSLGCANCYAERRSKRLKGRYGYPADNPFAVTLHPDRLEQPLRWKKGRCVFVCSMSDLFHEDVPFDFIDKVSAVMALCPQHDFQVLTKRSKRMSEYITRIGRSLDFLEIPVRSMGRTLRYEGIGLVGWPLPNVWLGISAEDLPRLKKRVGDLLRTPAVVHFLSLEPLLGPIKFRYEDGGPMGCPWIVDALGGSRSIPDCDDPAWAKRETINWVILGGESGPGARPMELDWVRDIKRQCRRADVPLFIKQFGGYPDPRRVMSEWPRDLQIREFPKAAGSIPPN